MTRPDAANLVAQIERYLTQYVTLASPDYAFAAALWLVGTYLWPDFDAFPYLVITSDVKRSGKTRFAEVLGFAASNARHFTAASMAGIYTAIKEEAPTLFIDEAETLSSEAASGMRAVLNAGYRKGQSVPRYSKTGVIEWPTYCPKVYILIGDVFDTLRDRAIVVRMWRGEPPRRFLYTQAKAEGHALGTTIQAAAKAEHGRVLAHYTASPGLPFLMDRDEEIWHPLFAIAETWCPDRVKELRRVAVDLATEKTVEARKYINLQGAERVADDDEYARRLLRDLALVIDGKPMLYTATVLEALRAIETAPWRKFRGEGLTAEGMASLLRRFGVAPELIKSHGKVARGYRRADVERALRKL